MRRITAFLAVALLVALVPFVADHRAASASSAFVGVAETPTGDGQWLVDGDGHVSTVGAATHLGDLGGTRPARPIVGIAATPSGQGYWLVATDGGVFSFGDATFLGAARGPARAVVASTAGGYTVASANGMVQHLAPGMAPLIAYPKSIGARQAWLWPFSSESPWNMPLGTDAAYESPSAPATSSLLDGRATPYVNAGTYSHPVY